MAGWIGRTVVAAGAAAALLMPAAVASAGQLPTLSWSPATSAGTYAYSTLTVGQTASQTFTLTNAGGSASSALKITLTGSAAFTKTADSCTGTSLGPNKSCRVTVTYAPTAPGQTDTATLTSASNKPAATARLTLTGSAAKAAPAISTVQQPATAVVGASVADQATVSGGDSPAGTVTFTLYDNPTCDGTPLFTDTETLSGGSATSAGYTAVTAGTDYWVATYNGDASNSQVTSPCGAEPVTISPAITIAPSSGGPVGNTNVTGTAILSGGNNPTGSITFNLYPARDCSGTPLDTETVAVTGNGSYTTPAGATPAQAGIYYWTASYSGDASNAPVATGCNDGPVTITGDLTLTPGRFNRALSPNENDYTGQLQEEPAGSSTTQTFTVTNSGNSTSDVLDVSNSGDRAFTVGNDTCGRTALNPGGTCTFDVTFTAPAGCPAGQDNSGTVAVGGLTSRTLYIILVLDARCGGT